jgi:hypothetical protein
MLYLKIGLFAEVYFHWVDDELRPRGSHWKLTSGPNHRVKIQNEFAREGQRNRIGTI